MFSIKMPLDTKFLQFWWFTYFCAKLCLENLHTFSADFFGLKSGIRRRRRRRMGMMMMTMMMAVMMTTIVTTSITFDWWPRARSSRIQEEFITQSEVKAWIIIIYFVFKWKLSHSQKHFWHTWYVWRISDFFAWQISNSPKCGEIWNLPCIVAIYDILLPNLLFHDLHAFAWRKI